MGAKILDAVGATTVVAAGTKEVVSGSKVVVTPGKLVVLKGITEVRPSLSREVGAIPTVPGSADVDVDCIGGMLEV